jgi:diacylglycerol kinase (ATP)
MRARTVLESYRFAMDGLVRMLETEHHVRYYFVFIVAVLALSVVLRVNKTELILLTFTIALVLVAELANTAVEMLVNLTTESYHPLAKAAKDVAGAMVLVSTTTALLVGALIFLDRMRLRQWLHEPLHREADPLRAMLHVIYVGIPIVAVLVVLGKLRARRGTITRGGALSGHSALAAFLATAAWYLGASGGVMVLAVGLWLLVAQSRIDAGIHSLWEVLAGGALAVVVAVVLFQAVAIIR